MTRVFFVRHAEPNYENHDDMTREPLIRDSMTENLLHLF